MKTRHLATLAAYLAMRVAALALILGPVSRAEAQTPAAPGGAGLEATVSVMEPQAAAAASDGYLGFTYTRKCSGDSWTGDVTNGAVPPKATVGWYSFVQRPIETAIYNHYNGGCITLTHDGTSRQILCGNPLRFPTGADGHATDPWLNGPASGVWSASDGGFIDCSLSTSAGHSWMIRVYWRMANVEISPSQVTVVRNGMVQFTARTANSKDPGVTWTVGGGSITRGGLYQAPGVPGVYSVTATSTFDPSRSATAYVTVAAPSVSVVPASVILRRRGTQQFSATVQNAANTSVAWNVPEAGGGIVSQAGFYTAPLVEGTYHVVASSVEDSTRTGAATITVAPVAVSVSPAAPTVLMDSSVLLTATVQYAADTSVSWRVLEGSVGGSVSGGRYTPPPAAGTYHVSATSVEDPSKAAIATITVPPVGVSVAPASVTVACGGAAQLAASVSNAANGAVSWNVWGGPGNGTVTSGGLYVAPTTPGTYYVEATSSVDASVSDVSVVTVPPGGAQCLPWLGSVLELLLDD